MSFFDEDDEPRSTSRARRAPAQGSGAAADPQTLLVRRAVALGAGLLVLILLVVAVRGCLDSRQRQALTDYNREIGALIEESDSQVGRPLFELLTQREADSPNDLQVSVSQLRVVADTQLRRARGLDVPGELAGAQRSFLIALEFRRDGVARIARLLPTALADEGEDAITQIAGQMQVFLASDIVYSQRVVPLVEHGLEEEGVGGQTVASSRFLPGVEWLAPETVADRLRVQAPRGGGRGKPAPGLHGSGLVSVAAGDVTLAPDGANRIPAASDLAFTVKFANQGEHEEFDVRVVVRIEGAGKPIRIARTVDTVAQGQEATVELPLSQAPPIGTPVTVSVEVEPVPGEEKTDNNSQEYPAIFTR